jgi:hypothetical protein
METGKTVATLDIVGDTDDLFYDAPNKRLYVSGGEGFISAFEQVDADRYTPFGRIPTATGARTSLFVAGAHKLYVAVPHRGNQVAELRVFEAASGH